MLSTTADYALRIMVVLAGESTGKPEAGGRPAALTSERLARATGVPPDYAIKVLQMLAQAGMVKAQRGRKGGFSLICSPTETTVLDVVNAIGPIAPLSSVNGTTDERLVPLHRRINQVISDANNQLARMTLRQIAEASPAEPVIGPVER